MQTYPDQPISARVVDHPPRCIASHGFHVAGIVDDRTVRFSLGAPGVNFGALLGHALSGLNPEYSGPEFVGPLSIHWAQADSPALLLDTDLHGYGGELSASAKLRGQGAPEIMRCPACEDSSFAFEVTFGYGDAVDDLLLDEPDIAAEDYFNLFLLSARCQRCGNTFVASELDL